MLLLMSVAIAGVYFCLVLLTYLEAMRCSKCLFHYKIVRKKCINMLLRRILAGGFV